MSRRASLCGLSWSSLFFVIAVLGCDGLGRPLVDELRVDPAPDPFSCGESVRCTSDDDSRRAKSPGLDVRMVALEQCGGVRADCADDSVTRGSDQTSKGCFRVWEIDESLKKRLERRSFQCSALSTFARESARVALDHVELTSTNLSVQATVPVTIQLRAAYLSNVWISLQGPVTLSLVDGWLDDVRFELGADARLDMDRTGSERLMVAGATGERAGTVTLRRMRVVESHLRASELRLESVSLDQTQLDADSFTAADLRWTDGILKADEATIAAAVVMLVDVKECRLLSILESYLLQVRAVACDELTRIYTSSVESSVFDGRIQSDISGFTRVRFGVRSATEISAWDTDFDHVALCEQQNHLWLGGESELQCVRCRDAEATLDACLLPDATTSGDAEECEQLVAPRTCEAPFPERERP